MNKFSWKIIVKFQLILVLWLSFSFINIYKETVEENVFKIRDFKDIKKRFTLCTYTRTCIK